jgi:hypothetical protein
VAEKRYTSTQEYLRMVRRMIRGAGKRVGRADPEDLAELVRLQAELDEAIRAAVAGLRGDGFTWESLGSATGTTRQAALMKWGH